MYKEAIVKKLMLVLIIILGLAAATGTYFAPDVAACLGERC